MSSDRNRMMRRFQAGRHIVMGLILIALAYAYEQATNHRRSPEFRER